MTTTDNSGVSNVRSSFPYRRNLGAFANRNKNRYEKVVNNPVRKMLNWSQYQINIFDDIANGQGNTSVNATAGSSKSTVILESLWRVDKHLIDNGRVLLTAFNKSIASHLASQVPVGVHVKTNHAHGLSLVRDFWRRYKIGQDGSIDNQNEIVNMLASNFVGDGQAHFFQRYSIARGVSLCKATMSISRDQIKKTLLDFSFDFNGINEDQFIEYVFSIIDQTSRAPLRNPRNGKFSINFDDMIFIPALYNLESKTKYDLILIDEAQDLSKIRSDLILGCLEKNSGRVIAVGDPQQSIYTFSGVSLHAYYDLQNRLNAKELPLNVSYRLPKSIIQYLKCLNDKIEPSPNAIDGKVTDMPVEDMWNSIGPGDYLLSRVNAPLVRACFKLIKNNKPSNILGRDLGDKIANKIKYQFKPNSVGELKIKIADWRDKQLEYYEIKKRDASAMLDEAACMESIVNEAGNDSLQNVFDVIDKMFKDACDPNTVTLSSIHKIKGKETKRVFVLTSSLKPNKNKEEDNLRFVSYSRASEELVLLSGAIEKTEKPIQV